ncbi:MAG TPA: transporter [Caulobacteraceae bacterium]
MSARSIVVATVVAWSALLGAGAALGQDAGTPTPDATTAPSPPDKSGFTVFNPTPTADLRALCTDRPSKSASPCTVDAGHFQVESDVFNFTADTSGGATTNTYLLSNPTLKLGLTNTLDVELSITPYEVITVRDHATDARSRAEGIGDLFAKVKWNLLGDDGGNIGLAISPYIKIPTANGQIGNRAVEGGLVGLTSFTLPKGWSLNLDPEVDVLRDATDGSRHINLQAPLSLNHAVSKEVTATLELWADANFDPVGTITQASFDLGLAWIPTKIPTFQLDGGVNFGLDRSTPAAQLYIGASKRF